jgi:hypothetical protein
MLFGITEGMLKTLDPRALKRKKWDIMGRIHSNITVMCWKDKSRRYITLICS